MTIFNPTSHRIVFAKDTNPTHDEIIWPADLMARFVELSKIADIVISSSAPAQDKIWYVPSADNSANGVFKYYNGAAWATLTTGKFAAHLLAKFGWPADTPGLLQNDGAGVYSYFKNGIFSANLGATGTSIPSGWPPTIQTNYAAPVNTLPGASWNGSVLTIGKAGLYQIETQTEAMAVGGANVTIALWVGRNGTATWGDVRNIPLTSSLAVAAQLCQTQSLAQGDTLDTRIYHNYGAPGLLKSLLKVTHLGNVA